jgi:hypothetical protein
MRDEEIRYLGDVQRLTLAPGDIVVLNVDMVISAETADRLKARAEKQLPGHQVLILSGGVKLGVLAPERAA